ncbi:hepatocyte nuclear factor 6 [Trichonephila clavipes]|nr:hepatocyte nuclear factor 6 [Trichonephila clavipes]
MSRRKPRSAFDQVSEFDRGRIVAYRDCGLSFREIRSHVGRNQTTVMRICDHWMQEGTTDRRVSACTIRRRLQKSGLSARRPLLGLPLTQNHRRLRRQWCDERRMCVAEWNEIVITDESRICLQHHNGRIRVWRHRGERVLNICVMHRHAGPAPGIMVWGGIGCSSRTPLVRTAACKRKEDQQQAKQQNTPKKPRLVFTDLQRRTLQAIFKETKRPSKEMQITISQQLGLELSTVGNFFMNARRRSQDKWQEEVDNKCVTTTVVVPKNNSSTTNNSSDTTSPDLITPTTTTILTTIVTTS